MGVGERKQVSVACAQCGAAFLRRRDKAEGEVFCSQACFGASRRTPGSPWSEHSPVEARRDYFRAHLADNRERHNERGREWASANRPKRNRIQQVRRASGSITQAEWDEVTARSGGRCCHCGTTNRIEIDHILPVSRGGLTVPDNLQALCRSCNASKGARVGVAPGTISEIG